MALVVVAGSENSVTFAVIDFTNPASPTVTSVNPGFGAGCRVALDGNNVAVGSVLGGEVRLVNVAHPAAPVQRPTVTTTLAGVGAVAVLGSLVAAGEQNGTRVVLIDYSNPASPVIKATATTTQGGFSSLAFRTPTVVVGSGPNDFNGVQVDFSNSTNPVVSTFPVAFAGSPSLDADATTDTIVIGDTGGVNVKLLDGATKAVLGTANSGLSSVTVALSGQTVLAASPNSVNAARIDFSIPGSPTVSAFNPGLAGGSTTAIDGGHGACGAILGSEVKLIDLTATPPAVVGTANAGIPSIATLDLGSPTGLPGRAAQGAGVVHEGRAGGRAGRPPQQRVGDRGPRRPGGRR
jgi:hypothetical protein